MFYLNRPGSKISRGSIADIEQALRLLATTRKGEIPYNPDYGLEAIYSIVGDWEVITSEIEREMNLAIQQFEDRVASVTVKAVRMLNASGKSIRLEVAYSFMASSQFFAVTVPVKF